MTREENCPNCGAPYDSSLNACPYCKTSYFDMSAIDLNDRRPMWLKLRMGDMTFTSKVVVSPDLSVSLTEDTYEAYDGHDRKVLARASTKTADIDITFHSVGDGKTLFTMEVNN